MLIYINTSILHRIWSRSEFLFTDGGFAKNAIIFGADMSTSVHIKGKDMLILVEGPMQGLDDTTLTAEVKYSINFTQTGKNVVKSEH